MRRKRKRKPSPAQIRQRARFQVQYGKKMHLSERGLSLLKQFQPSPPEGEDPRLTEAKLREEIVMVEQALRRLILVPLTQSMFDALVLFTHSVTPAALKESKLLVDLNRTAYLNVPEQMARWKWDAGMNSPVRGLLIRRLAEGLLFLQDGIPENAVRQVTE